MVSCSLADVPIRHLPETGLFGRVWQIISASRAFYVSLTYRGAKSDANDNGYYRYLGTLRFASLCLLHFGRRWELSDQTDVVAVKVLPQLNL